MMVRGIVVPQFLGFEYPFAYSNAKISKKQGGLVFFGEKIQKKQYI